MIRRPALFLSAGFALALAWTGVAHAQPLDKDADADRLFKEGQKLMEERRFAEACPKLESAYKKDQQLGTLLNLAYCHKEQGSTWLAWVEFREGESKAAELKRNDRRDFARDKMRDLEKNLTKVVIDPKPGIELVEVDVEDRRVFDAEKFTPFSAEPGQRKVTFHAKGKKPGILLVNVGPAKENRDKVQHIAIPELLTEEPIATTVADPVPPIRTVEPQPPSDTHSTWSSQKTIAVVAGALGVGGLAVGGIFGVMTLSGKCRDGQGVGDACFQSDLDGAEQKAMISNIGFIAGGVLLAGAVVLWITAPSDSGRSARASLGPGWAGLSGTF